MINTQTPERRTDSDGTMLEVHSIFYTIQGEGPFSGKPAIFIRLAGCNLQCPGCDTEYTAGRKAVRYGQVIQQVEATGNAKDFFPLVVITGGEPFRQNLTPLVHRLVELGYAVQIETNGTLPPSQGLLKSVYIVCSPKAGKVHPLLLSRINCFKYILDASHVDQSDGLPTSTLGSLAPPARPPRAFGGTIYVSPMDHGKDCPQSNQANIAKVVEICQRYGYTLNLQLHKLLGLP